MRGKTWLKLDASLPSDPKIMGLTDAQFRAWITVLCHCRQHHTDGLVGLLPGMRKASMAALVTAGLLAVEGDGWRVVKWGSWQASREQLEAKSSANRLRVNAHRSRKNADVMHYNGITTRTDKDKDKELTVTTELVGTELASSELSLSEVKSIPLHRNAREAIQRIEQRMSDGRKAGGNGWNLSAMVASEWDGLYAADDFEACVELTAWWMGMVGNPLDVSGFIRLAGLFRQFGRLTLTAVETAIAAQAKNPLAYAHRVAKRAHEEATA